MSGAATRLLWCTTCGEYVRPGTHGIHPMRFTGGTDPSIQTEPETSGAASVVIVVLIVLALAVTGGALFAGAMLLYRAT